MIKNSEKQKYSEIEWANFFSQWLNSELGSDYKPFANEVEKSIVDIFLKSPSKKFTKLRLQLTSGEPQIEYRYSAMMRKRPCSEREAISQNNSIADIDNAIFRKTKQSIEKYGESETNSTILLVHGLLMEPPGENWFTDEFIEKHQQNSFAGIYYIRPFQEKVKQIKVPIIIKNLVR